MHGHPEGKFFLNSNAFLAVSNNFVEMIDFASNSTVDYLESSTYILIACGFSKGQRSLDSDLGKLSVT